MMKKKRRSGIFLGGRVAAFSDNGLILFLKPRYGKSENESLKEETQKGLLLSFGSARG